MLPRFDTTLQKNCLTSKMAKDITTQGLDIDLSLMMLTVIIWLTLQHYDTFAVIP